MLERIKSDLHQAQLDKDEVKVSTLRMLISEINNAQIAKGGQLQDEEIVAVILREVKKRKEASTAFRQGQREDQAQKEESEAEILSVFLPQQLADEELTKIVETSINEVGAKSISDMGKVIGVVMGKVKAQADGGRVSALVREKLNG